MRFSSMGTALTDRKFALAIIIKAVVDDGIVYGICSHCDFLYDFFSSIHSS